jgi:hypothetical protein
MDEDKRAQVDRFKEAARKAGADEAPDALDRAFGKLKIRMDETEIGSGSKAGQRGGTATEG